MSNADAKHVPENGFDIADQWQRSPWTISSACSQYLSRLASFTLPGGFHDCFNGPSQSYDLGS